jgi:hypothetical protein
MYLTPAEYRAMYLVEAERLVIAAAERWFDLPTYRNDLHGADMQLAAAVFNLRKARAESPHG